MNPESLRKTSVSARILCRVTLNGYQRKANAMHEAFPEVAMNIVPNEAFAVTGVLIDFPETDLPALRQRETGYEMVNVTDLITSAQSNLIYTFVAPNLTEYAGKKIHQEYLDVCLGGVPQEQQDQWLKETVIECEVTTRPRQRTYRHS